MTPSAPLRRQRGLALVLVLWFVTVLSLLALAFGYQQRTGIHITRNLLDATRALQLAEAATQRAIHRLLSGDGDETTTGGDATWTDFTLDRARLRYRVEREAEKLDLRRADPSRLRRLLESLGLSGGRARLLAEAIVRERDGDGGQGDDNDGVGLASMRALRRIEGIDHSLYRRLLTRATLYGNTTAGGAAYTVLAEARTPTGAMVTTRSVIWLPGDGEPPYYRLDFEQSPASRPEPEERP